MKYDKIRGKSVAECMMKLRSAYGSSAIILSTREVQEGGLLGSGLFSRKLYEIDFMLPEEGAASSSRPLISVSGGSGPRDRSALGRALMDAARTHSQSGERAARTGTAVAAADALARKAAEGVVPPLSALKNGGLGARTPQTPEEIVLERQALDLLLSDADLESEIADRSKHRGSAASDRGLPQTKALPVFRDSHGDLAAESSGSSRSNFDDGQDHEGVDGVRNISSAGRSPDSVDAPRRSIGGGVENEGEERFGRILHRIRGRLLSSQVSSDFADRFLQRVDHSLSRVERAEYRNVEERSLKKLAEVIRTVPDIAPRHGECQAVMLIGPTGAGKTTSLAKLAARYHIMQGREVSIYSLDHYRLAATEQLKTYAGVMDVPFFAPLSPRDFAEYLRRDGAELMLIDTSGIGYRDADRIEQLQQYVDACEVRLEKHLVLAANTNGAMLEKILLAYDRIGLDKIILTKLDESDFLGAFIELADKYNRPFSFLMNGQDVPGSILEAESMELARMVLSGPGGKGDRMGSGD